MTRKTDRFLAEAAYSAGQETNEIWVYLEHHQDELANVSLELLGKARDLGQRASSRVIGLLLGYQVNPIAEAAIQFGAEEVRAIDDPRLKTFHVEAYTDAATQAIIEGKPSILLIGATHDGRDLAGRLAVCLQTGLNADCTELLFDSESGLLVSEVTGFGGGIIALLECPERRPQMSTVRPGVFPLPEKDVKRTGAILRIDITLEDLVDQTRVLEQETHQGVDLTQAEMLVCGGRGVEGDFESLFNLANMLHADVGATRPPVDDGFIERERQVGQTGVVCRPKVALCLGISGAFHFVVGIEKADLVIAVNSDPSAPIFEYADYGIVADVKDFLPVLMQAFEKYRERAHA